MISLTLDNFESEEASNYPYILTSPRSLKSCRLASIRPIELLHRSLQDLSKDKNMTVNLRYSNQFYEDYENERLRKLEVCKMIRKHILAAQDQNYSAGIMSKSAKQYLNENQLDKRGSTPEFLPCIKQQRSFTPASSPQRSCAGSPMKKGIKLNLINESSSSSETSSPFNPRETGRGHLVRRTKSAESNRYNSVAESVRMKKSISSTPLIKKVDLKCQFYPKNNKRSHSQTLEKHPSDRQLCWQVDKMKKSKNNLPNHSRKEKKINFEKQDNDVKNGKNRISDSNVVIEKNSLGGKSRSRKDSTWKQETLEGIKNTKNQHNNLNEKIKGRMTETSGVKDFSDPVDSIKNHDIRILDAMFFNREKEQLEKNFARKADLIWDACGCKNFFTDKNTDYTSKTKRYISTGEKPDVCTCNENRMFNLYFQQIRNKMKQLKEDSLSKELHSEQVRQLARELQTGMEQWQDQVLLLQWRALQKAKINAKLQLESKRLKIQTENNERTLLHALRFRNVREMERIRQQIVKKEIQEKDNRIERLKIKREREIMDCKAQAQYTAELRDQLRRTLTPETFDKKVNDAISKSKFITRALTSSPLVESHIRLG